MASSKLTSRTSDSKDRPPDQTTVQGTEHKYGFIPAPALAAAGFVRFSGDPNYDANAVAVSQKSLLEYEKIFSGWMKEDKYPLRIRLARHTGLPAQLTGLLDEIAHIKEAASALDVARSWLAKTVISAALLGDEKVVSDEERLRDPQVVQMSAPGEGQLNAHVTFRQWLGELPVHGGQVVVHLTDGLKRVAVSNSYMPLKLDSTLKPPPDLEKAKARARELARQALLDMLPPQDAVGLYWDELAPWLVGKMDVSTWGDDQMRWLDLLLRGLVGIQAIPPEKAAAVWAMATGKDLDGAPMRLDVVPYAGSEVFIFPFGGKYYVAMQIEYVPARPQNPYRVFVDVQGWNVLGEPDPLASFAPQVFSSSANVPDNAQQLTALELQTLATDLDHFALISHPLASNQDDPEVVNVAYHTVQMFNHFKWLLNNDDSKLVSYRYPDAVNGPNTQRQGLLLRVKISGSDYIMKTFLESDTNPKEIWFQTDQSGGLLVSDPPNKKVYAPSLDPEVIYHELTHAFSWMINRSPFELHSNSIPFWRPLTEGYANYFGRSLGARADTSANTSGDNLWAAAAYPKAMWDTEEALSRQNMVDNQDRLAVPDLYPNVSTQGHAVYQVGMVWARALWNLRVLIGADDAAKAALNAYMHLHGWIVNYETAAEALLLELERVSIAPNTIAQFQNKLADRGIYAERGVQALVEGKDDNDNSIVMVGADKLLGQVSNNVWSNTRSDLDVIALAASGDGRTLYAATVTGVYQNADPPDDASWTLLPGFPSDLTPLCITEDQGFAYVGTPNGVWRFHAANAAAGWTAWRRNDATGFSGIAWDLIAAQVLGIDNNVYHVLLVAGLNNLGRLTEIAGPQGVRSQPDVWVPITCDPPDPPSNARTTCLTFLDNTLYLGTLAHGIWRRQNLQYEPGFGLTGGQCQKMPALVEMNDKAILCLAHDSVGHCLLAGTNDGIFFHDLQQPSSAWYPLPGAPAKMMVRQILVVGSDLYVATFNQGLRQRNAAQVWS